MGEGVAPVHGGVVLGGWDVCQEVRETQRGTKVKALTELKQRFKQRSNEHSTKGHAAVRKEPTELDCKAPLQPDRTARVGTRTDHQDRMQHRQVGCNTARSDHGNGATPLASAWPSPGATAPSPVAGLALGASCRRFAARTGLGPG